MAIEAVAEAPHLKLDDLLLSKRVREVHHDPFFYFHIDNYLPQELYKNLLAQFPSQDCFTSETKSGTKKHFDTTRDMDRFNEFCQKHPSWLQLVDIFRHPLFLQDMGKVVRPGLLKSRGLKALKGWHDTTERKEKSGKIPFWELPIQMDFQFSHMERGSFIQPHSDAGRKLVSILLYLPPPGWKEEYGGGTRFFRGRDSKKVKKWANWNINTVPEERLAEFYQDMEPFEEISFKPNRLALFLKSDRTYHDVAELQCPQGMVRTSFNANVNLA